MRIDLEFVELHTPLFLDGKNFGTKLYSDRTKNSKGELEIWYETDLEHTFVISNGKIAMIEATASKTIANPEQLKDYVKATVKNPMMSHKNVEATMVSVNRAQAQVAGPGIGLKSAQVATPMDKVQGTPGKKPKFQGQESQGE